MCIQWCYYERLVSALVGRVEALLASARPFLTFLESERGCGLINQYFKQPQSHLCTSLVCSFLNLHSYGLGIVKVLVCFVALENYVITPFIDSWQNPTACHSFKGLLSVDTFTVSKGVSQGHERESRETFDTPYRKSPRNPSHKSRQK